MNSILIAKLLIALGFCGMGVGLYNGWQEFMGYTDHKCFKGDIFNLIGCGFFGFMIPIVGSVMLAGLVGAASFLLGGILP